MKSLRQLHESYFSLVSLRNATRYFCLVIVMLYSSGCSSKATSGTAKEVITETYAFYNVSVIPMTEDIVLKNQTVVVKGSQIIRVVPSDQFELPMGVTTIDGTGQFLVPGLADMHVHIMDKKDLLLYVANGVTQIRNMWGEPRHLKMREKVLSGEVVGPSIVTAGRIVDGVPKAWPDSDGIDTVDDAKRIVAEQKAAGYDFIKVYSGMSLEVFDAVIKTAKINHIPVAGHIPSVVPLDHGMRSGMASMEHLMGFKRAIVSDGVSLGANILSKEMQIVGEKLKNQEITLENVFDTDRTAKMVSLAVNAGIWNVPTLLAMKNIFLTRKEVAQKFYSPQMRFIAPEIRSVWNPENDFRRKNFTDEQLKNFQAFFESDLNLVRTLHEAGAPIMAGTDAPNPFVFPGFSLYEELDLMVRAGLSPYEAIRTATYNPAKFLGAVGDFGTITEGARADLILLKKNPLEMIGHFQTRTGVMLRGQWFLEEKLQEILEEVAVFHSAQSKSVKLNKTKVGK